MFIMAQGGECYARLRFNVGPGGDVILPVGVSYARSFPATDRHSWAAEYKANILPEVSTYGLQGGQDDWFLAGSTPAGRTFDAGEANIPQDWLEELELMEPAERQAIIEELASGNLLEGDFYG